MNAQTIFNKLRPNTLEVIVTDLQKQLKSLDDFLSTSDKPDPNDNAEKFKEIRDLELLAVKAFNFVSAEKQLKPYKLCEKSESYLQLDNVKKNNLPR